MHGSLAKSIIAANDRQLRRRHPLLRAFDRADFGRLTLRTPENQLIQFKGSRPGPEADWHIRNWRALDAVVQRGEIGFASGYIGNDWDTTDLASLVMFGLANAQTLERFFYGRPWYALWVRVRDLWHRNTLSGSRHNIIEHYDLGNDFYALWLDQSMTYSCALFGDNANLSLEEAQEAKYRRILSKLALKPGAHILDIGCGWGAFLEFAARAGYEVTGLTISDAQKNFADARLRRAGLADKARVELKDYRKAAGSYDGVVSIGMFEHVGEEYWPAYFAAVRSLLKPGGRAMIQCITLDESVFARARHRRGFIEEVIFPGGCLPAKPEFAACAAKAGLACREMFAFGKDYARTLQHWMDRFEAKKNEVARLGYGDPFMRLWRFYLASCIASFTTQRTDVMQAELMRMENP